MTSRKNDIFASSSLMEIKNTFKYLFKPNSAFKREDRRRPNKSELLFVLNAGARENSCVRYKQSKNDVLRVNAANFRQIHHQLNDL